MLSKVVFIAVFILVVLIMVVWIQSGTRLIALNYRCHRICILPPISYSERSVIDACYCISYSFWAFVVIQLVFDRNGVHMEIVVNPPSVTMQSSQGHYIPPQIESTA